MQIRREAQQTSHSQIAQPSTSKAREETAYNQKLQKVVSDPTLKVNKLQKGLLNPRSKAPVLELPQIEQQLLNMLKTHDVEAWSLWRQEHPKLQPDFSGADLHGLDLREFDLRGAILAKANLSDTNLQGVNLSEAVLEHADLSRANLNLANLPDAKLSDATLVGTKLKGADLRKAKLIRANMTDADLSEAILQDVDLTKAVSKKTNLTQADLTGAELSGANLRGAILKKATLSATILKGANFNGVSLGQTIFANVDLSGTKGLGTVNHLESSTIDIDTIARSQSNIPEEFLRRAGIPDIIIDSMLSRADHPIKFHTCFISYSSKDEVFAKRLYSDLSRLGVHCDFAPESLKSGEPFNSRIVEYIQKNDKLLLIFSEHSLHSTWVEKEAEIAIQKEGVLLPFQIDNAAQTTDQAWAANIRDTYHIGDFTSWQQPHAYLLAIAHLLRDLKADPGEYY